MVFNSVVFGLFLAVALLTYWTAPPHLRNGILVVGSYFFYGWWDWRFLSLLAISTIVDFSIGQIMGRQHVQRRRTQLLVTSAIVNLGILATFKYFGFFVESLSALTTSLGLGELSPALQVVLPVGISFYTFQTLSYTFDIYRRRIGPTRNIVDFAAYVSYFPQLVAGPIERAQRLLPQIESTDRTVPRGDRLVAAGALVLQGLFKKVVLADGVAPVVNEVFGAPGQQSGLMLTVGVLAFGIQIYGDFSGYTDIARGVSRLFDIELVVNFTQPYLSRNITEFWRRWHISLSNWLRDYLYVPLGGNRGTQLATYRNLMITMLLGGLWHGASWNFVVWGGLHGLYLVAHKLVRGGAVSDQPIASRDMPSIITTFVVVHLAWVFFRADTFADSWEVLGGIATMQAGSASAPDILLVAVIAAATLGLDLLTRRGPVVAELARRSPAATGFAVGVVLTAIVVFSGGTPEPFIYFQF